MIEIGVLVQNGHAPGYGMLSFVQICPPYYCYFCHRYIKPFFQFSLVNLTTILFFLKNQYMGGQNWTKLSFGYDSYDPSHYKNGAPITLRNVGG